MSSIVLALLQNAGSFSVFAEREEFERFIAQVPRQPTVEWMAILMVASIVVVSVGIILKLVL